MQSKQSSVQALPPISHECSEMKLGKLLIFSLSLLACTVAYASTITVTSIERNSRTSIKINWDLTSDAGALVESGSVSLQFVGIGDINPATGTTYTKQERLQAVKDQFVDFAGSYLKRYNSGESDFDGHVQKLVGFTVTR